MQRAVSVVVPVYNAQHYLAKKLDSILSQTLQDIEIICVNDGSTDFSLEILRRYEAADARIVVIDQENSGIAKARNAGMKIAAGRYFSFLDFDDFYKTDTLEKAYAKAMATDADVVVFDADTFCAQTEEFEPYAYSIQDTVVPADKEFFAGTDLADDVFRVFRDSSWGKLFRAEFVRDLGLEFQDLPTSNDTYFVYCATARANRISIVHDVPAHHRQGMKGLLETHDVSWHCYHDALMAIKRQLQVWGLFNQFERGFVNYCLHATLCRLEALDDAARCALQEKLVDEWFAEFGVLDRDSAFFYHQDDCQKVELIIAGRSPRVSIAIPSLNSADYYRECIESAMSQTMRELEIICVDAGSDDGTVDIIRRCQKRDPRIRFITSDMRSYGHQMNLALRAARGEFLSILESDDYIGKDCCQTYYDIAQQHKLDFVKSDTGVFKGSGDKRKVTPRRLSKFEAIYNRVWNPSAEPALMRMFNLTQPGLYRMSFLRCHQVEYHESPGASFQDNGFHFQVFAYGERAMFTHDVLYFLRRDNPNSSVMSKGKVFAICDEYDYIRNLLKERGLDEYLPMCANRRFGNYEWTARRIGDCHRPVFFERYAQDFRRLEEAGELRRELFTPSDWMKIHEVMQWGSGYYCVGWMRQRCTGSPKRGKSKSESWGAVVRRIKPATFKPSNLKRHAVNVARRIHDSVDGDNRRGQLTDRPLSQGAIVNPFDFAEYDYFHSMPASELKPQLERVYMKELGGMPNLGSPVLYSEKAQVAKLDECLQEQRAVLLNRATAPSVLAGRGLNGVLPQIYGVWDSLDNVDESVLPDAFYLVCSHGPDAGMAIERKELLHENAVRKQYDTWLAGDFSCTNELQREYAGIHPCVVAEELIGRQASEYVEYIVWCFEGTARLVEMKSVRGESEYLSFFSRDWEWLPFSYQSCSVYDVKPARPDGLMHMLGLAETAALGSDHMRVHFRKHAGVFRIVKLSAAPHGGFIQWSTPEADFILGSFWDIR